MAHRRSNAEWSADTIEALTRVATEHFARDGFRSASVESIASEAGLTKGAIYYHFKSKRGLFEVVLRAAQHEVVTRIDARATATADPIESIVAGCQAFLEVGLDDNLRQIVLVDGPGVLGWSTWRAIDGELGLGSLKEGLDAWRRQTGAQVNVDALAHLISGALNEAVFVVAEATDRAVEHRRVVDAMEYLLKSVLAEPSHAKGHSR